MFQVSWGAIGCCTEVAGTERGAGVEELRTWVDIFILGLRFGDAGAAGSIAFSELIPFDTFPSAYCF